MRMLTKIYVMKKAFERPSHTAIKKHIQVLAQIKANYEISINRALEAIQYMNALKAHSIRL